MSTSSCSKHLRDLIVTAIFGAVASSFSAVTAADTYSVSVAVRYADLNVASPSDALVLYERIRAAAKTACWYFLFDTDEEIAHCVHNAIAGAVEKIGQPALIAVYDSKLKTPAKHSRVSQCRQRRG